MQFAGSRVRRYAVGTLGILAVLVFLVAFFPWNWLRGPIASIASTRLQRTVAIGHIDVDWGLPTLVAVDDLTIGNAEWSKTPLMATFPRTVFTFSIPSLLRMTPDIVQLTRPDVLLERNAAGDANWHFDDAAGHTGAAFGAIDVDKGIVRYRDALLPASVDATLQTDATAARSLKFAGKGTLRGDPFEIQGTSEGIAELRRVNAPYHLAVSARAGATSMTFDGTAIPASLENAEGLLHVKGPDLSRLYPIVPSPLP